MRTRAGMAAGAVALVIGGLAVQAGGATAQEPCGGLLQPPCPTPTPTPSPTPTPTPAPTVVPAAVSLAAAPAAVAFDGRRSGRVRLAGRVAGDGPVGGLRVRLTGRAPAYGRTAVTRTATTDAAGNFGFSLRPQLNTRYRVAVADGQALEGRSPARTVRVFPVLRLDNRARGRGLEISVSGLAPARLRLEGKRRAIRPGSADRAFFYLRLRGESRYRRVGSAALGPVRCADTCRRTARHVERRISILRRTRNVGVCVRGTVFRGFGGPTRCGGPRMRF